MAGLRDDVNLTPGGKKVSDSGCDVGYTWPGGNVTPEFGVDRERSTLIICAEVGKVWLLWLLWADMGCHSSTNLV
jgi:hypothetical protein